MKQAAHLIMALPNVIWPWSIFDSKGQLLRKETKESLGVFDFSKLINCLGSMCQTCQGTTIYEMFGIYNFENLKCLNFDVWILKVENWNLYGKCLKSKILKT